MLVVLGISDSGSYNSEAFLAGMGEHAAIRCALYPTFQINPHDNNFRMRPWKPSQGCCRSKYRNELTASTTQAIEDRVLEQSNQPIAGTTDFTLALNYVKVVHRSRRLDAVHARRTDSKQICTSEANVFLLEAPVSVYLITPCQARAVLSSKPTLTVIESQLWTIAMSVSIKA